jgi:microcystin-dependent protein
MAADTYDSILGLLLQGTGNNNNTWGALTNTGVIELIARAVAGRAANAVTGGTLDLDNTVPPAGPTAAMDHIQYFSGTLSSNQIVLVPNVAKTWLVHNALTMDEYTLTFKTASGSASAAIPVGLCLVHCNGSDAMFVGLSTSLRDTQWVGADGVLAAPGLSFTAEPTTGFWRKSDGVVSCSILGTEIFNISASGFTIVSGALLGVTSLPQPGDFKLTLRKTADAGWLMCDDTTIGNASSGATHKTGDVAGLDVSELYAILWGVDNAYCPVYNSDGSASTRGANAAADYAANKRIAMTKMLGRALAISGSGSGLTPRALGLTVGAETVLLDATMIPAHQHDVFIKDPGHNHTFPVQANEMNVSGTTGYKAGGATNTSTSTTGITIGSVSGTANDNKTASIGGGLAHENMQPSAFLNAMLKL